MPGLGLFEIIIILGAIIIFVRPEDLPKVVRNIGRIYGELQRQLNQFKYMTRDAMDNVRLDQMPTAPPPDVADPAPSPADESETNPDESETNPDESETNPDESDTNPDESETNPDESVDAG
jgi:Sec-independent protein translocase protein TatA